MDSLSPLEGENTTLLTAESDFFRVGGDIASYEGSPTGVEVNLFANTGRFGDAGGDTFQSIENLLGSAYGDTLIGNDFNNDINPGLRDPDSVGGGILDSVDGGLGRDRLTVDYSTRDYSEYSGVTGGFTGEPNEGSLIRSGSRSGLNDEIRFSKLERLYIIGTSKRDELYGGSDSDIFYTGAGNDLVNSGGGDDVINVDDGNDTVNAGEGNDSIAAGSGNDSIDGGLGDNTIDGGEGNDELRGNQGGDTLIGGDGNDTLLGSNSLSSDFTYDALIGGAGADRFVLGNSSEYFYSDLVIETQASISIQQATEGYVPKAFADIKDFNPSDGDIIQLARGNYVFAESPNGTALYRSVTGRGEFPPTTIYLVAFLERFSIPTGSIPDNTTGFEIASV